MDAVDFAMERHGEQKRKYTNEPYYEHLSEVASLVPQRLKDIAWLHDILEDTKTTYEELVELFGERTASMVMALSDLNGPAFGNRKQRKKAYRDQLAIQSGDVHTVKLADLISNTSSIVLHDPRFARVYIAEKRDLLQVLNCGDPGLWFVANSMLRLSERILQD